MILFIYSTQKSKYVLKFSNGVLSMDQGAIVLKEMKEPQESPGLKFY